MKLQSSIIGRAKPEILTPIIGRLRQTRKTLFEITVKHAEPVLWVTVIIVAVFSVTAVTQESIKANNDKRIAQSKLYHYAIGQNLKCNPQADNDIGNNNPLNNNGWFACKVVAVSKDNQYYTTSYYNPDDHKTDTYQFQIQDVSDK